MSTFICGTRLLHNLIAVSTPFINIYPNNEPDGALCHQVSLFLEVIVYETERDTGLDG